MEARTWAARAHFGLASLFVICVAIQVFLIGLVLFNRGDIALHRTFGIITFVVAILVPVSAGIAGLPSKQVQRSAGLLGLTLVQMALAGLRYSGPNPIAALHPVGALVVFAFGVVVAREAWLLATGRAVEERAMPAGAAGSASSRPVE